jgi:7-cyano-7-deazaguanine synthase in queuosine biosynthesis
MRYVLMNSGGCESLATAILLWKQGHELHSLHIDVGVPSQARNSVAAAAIAEMYCVDHKEIELHGLLPEINQQNRAIRYQPFILASIGCSYAATLDIANVATGNTGDSISEEFEDLFNACHRSYFRPGQKLYRPLLGVSDFNQVYIIMKDSPLVHDTVSCPEEPKCGVCPKCNKRRLFNIDL